VVPDLLQGLQRLPTHAHLRSQDGRFCKNGANF
jgi:hypothetical protein